MGLNHVLLILMVVITICKPSIQDISFLITRTKILNDANSEDQHSVIIQGNGIDTEIKIELKFDLAPVLIIGNGFILGDPRQDSVTAYTDTANTLVMISDKRECVRRTRQDDGKERHQGLPDTECQELIQTIVKAWDEFKESGAVNKYNNREVIYVIKTIMKESLLSVCLGSIRISGLGVDDTLEMPCSNVDSTEVLFIPGGLIVNGGNIVYTNTYGQLTTVKDTYCEKKVFKEYEKVTSVVLESRMSFKKEDVSTNDCTMLRNTVNNLLEQPLTDIKIKRLDYSIENNVTYQQFSIEGNGIQETVIIPETAAQNMQLLYIPGGFILGDWEGNLAFVYSDSLNTLVQITPDQCVEATYEKGKLDKKTPTERGPHLKKMADVWNESGKKMAANGFTVHRYSREQNGQCDQDIIVEGQGVKNLMTVPCVSGNAIQTIFTDKGVMVGHYKRNLNSLFSETEGQIVIVERKYCKRHSYIGKGPSIKVMTDWECQRIKKKMDATVNFHNQGYLVSLDKRNKEFQVSRENYVNNNEICKQDINLSGKGIAKVVNAFCSTADNKDLILMQEGFLLGDFRHDEICVLAETPGKLVVIKNKGAICETLLYNELGEVSEKPINTEDCEKTKRFVEATLNDKQSNRFWTITPPGKSANVDNNNILIEIVKIDKMQEKESYVKIKGNGIDDNIKFEMEEDTTTFFKPGGFILGNFKTNSKYIYSSEPNTLFEVKKKKNMWKCIKWTYFGGKKSDYSMDDKECTKIKSTGEDLWNVVNDKLYKKTVTLKGINIIKRMSSTDVNCVGSLIVQGDGMDHTEYVDCASLSSTNVLFTLHGVVVGDPSRTPVTLFSDGARSMVIFKDGECFKKKYIHWYQSLNTNTFTFYNYPMTENACTQVKNTITEYLKANVAEE